jgi:hypothetical protein
MFNAPERNGKGHLRIMVLSGLHWDWEIERGTVEIEITPIQSGVLIPILLNRRTIAGKQPRCSGAAEILEDRRYVCEREMNPTIPA